MDWLTRVAAYAVIVQDRRILLSHWIGDPDRGRDPAWTLPGGGMEPGESPEETVFREVREETGYLVRVDGLLGITTDWFPPDDAVPTLRHAVRLIFAATITDGTLGVLERDGSTDDARWMQGSAVESLLRTPVVDAGMEFARETL